MRPLLPLLIAASFSSVALAQNGSLSLDNVIDAALVQSPAIKQADAARDAQTERVRGSWADVGPKLTAEMTQAKSDSYESKVGSLTATQPIIGLFALVEKARYEGLNKESSIASTNLAHAEVAFGTAQLYLRAQQALKQVDIAAANAAAAEKQRKDGEALATAGRINRDEFLRLDLELSRAKVAEAKAAAGRDIALRSLGQAIGRPSSEPLTIEALRPIDASAAQIPDLATATRNAFDRRLEREQARRAVDATGFGKELAYTAYAPSLNIFSRWDRNFGDPTPTSPAKNHSVGLQLNWLLWDNGSKVFAIREAAAQERRAEAQMLSIDQAIETEVFAAVANLKASTAALTFAANAAAKAQESHRIAQERFRAGAISTTDLLLAQATKVLVEGEVLATEIDYQLQIFAFQKAIGERRPSVNMTTHTN